MWRHNVQACGTCWRVTGSQACPPPLSLSVGATERRYLTGPAMSRRRRRSCPRRVARSCLPAELSRSQHARSATSSATCCPSTLWSGPKMTSTCRRTARGRSSTASWSCISTCAWRTESRLARQRWMRRCRLLWRSGLRRSRTPRVGSGRSRPARSAVNCVAGWPRNALLPARVTGRPTPSCRLAAPVRGPEDPVCHRLKSSSQTARRCGSQG